MKVLNLFPLEMVTGKWLILISRLQILRVVSGLHSYGHPALPGYAPAWEEEEEEEGEEWGEEEEEPEEEEWQEEEEEVYPLAYTQCHLAPGEGVYAHEHARHKGQIIDEDLLSPGELAILHKARKRLLLFKVQLLPVVPWRVSCLVVVR